MQKLNTAQPAPVSQSPVVASSSRSKQPPTSAPTSSTSLPGWSSTALLIADMTVTSHMDKARNDTLTAINKCLNSDLAASTQNTYESILRTEIDRAQSD